MGNGAVAGHARCDTVCTEVPQFSGLGVISTPSVPPSISLTPIPKQILEKIKGGEYVNFDLLLPPSLSASATSSVSSIPMDDAGEYDINIKNIDGNPRISLSQVTQGKTRVKDYPTWSLA